MGPRTSSSPSSSSPLWESARFGDQLWGVPLFSNAGLLYYRTDLVDRVPRGWAELAEQAKELSGSHRIAGYVGQLARYEGLTVNLMEAIWGLGGDLLAENGRDLDVGATTRALTFLRDGINEGWIPGTARAYDEEQSRLAFQAAGRCSCATGPTPTTCSTPTTPRSEATSGSPSCPARARLAGPTWPSRRPPSERQQPYTLALRDSIREARSRPSTPYYGQVTRVIQDAAFSVLGRGEAPASAAQRLAERLPPALDGR